MALPLAAVVALIALAAAVVAAVASAAARRAATPFLDGASFKPMKLVEKVELTHNTRLFRYERERMGRGEWEANEGVAGGTRLISLICERDWEERPRTNPPFSLFTALPWTAPPKRWACPPASTSRSSCAL